LFVQKDCPSVPGLHGGCGCAGVRDREGGESCIGLPTEQI